MEQWQVPPSYRAAGSVSGADAAKARGARPLKEFFPAGFAVLTAVLLGLLFQAGCGSPGAAKTEPVAPAGQEATAPAGSGEKTAVVNEKYGFQLAVPAGWQVKTRDGREASATADLFLTYGGEHHVEVRVAAGEHGGIVGHDPNSRILRATKEQFTTLGGEGMLYRHVKTTAAGTRTEYHFVAAKNGFTFDIATEVPEDQETLPVYFQDILSGWRWRAPDTSLAALGTPGELVSIVMISETQGWALAKGTVLRTEDGGEHWEAVTPPGLPSNPWGIESKFYDADHAWLAVRNDNEKSVVVFHTADGGRTWGESAVHRGSNGLVYGGKLDFVDPDRGWLMIEPEHGMSSRPGELYQTADGGEHWSEVAKGATTGSAPENGLPFSGPFSFRNVLTGWLGGRQGAAFDPDHPLYMTEDGGCTWRPQDLPLPSGLPGGKLNVNTPPEFFPAGGQDGVLPVVFVPDSYKVSDYATLFYTTADGGRTWQCQASLPGTGPFSPITAVNWWVWREESDASGLAAPARGKLYHTTDGGVNWTVLEPAGDLSGALEKGERVQQLDFVTGKAGWLLLATADGQGTELLQTTDGGSTWTLVQVTIDPVPKTNTR
ncbi:WD40/YVTN/BNR-like repeat-containing protein [Moorella sp. Hama-1]|uniref:WD40/YVTN/BNR-like repeat-containing protein n=1 Tax=Moorella sp. Hama-1 TaxID=2138101 RepID=UPI000D658F31|nr:hypothetical protein [Moorella sp. Hama-1]BCV22570.1 hypothetical protein hamaS1_26390 [Moorella sp. Hama-1]